MPSVRTTSQDFSLAVGTTAVQVYTSAQIQTMANSRHGFIYFIRCLNAAPSNGATIWLSRSGPAVVNGAGSFPLAPGAFEIFQHPQALPQNTLWAIATGAGTPLTVEVG